MAGEFYKGHFSIVCSADFSDNDGIFIPILKERGGNSMTMMKREVNNIWAQVRADVDIDDLIFDYDDARARGDEACSER